jgi:hypothetical protein
MGGGFRCPDRGSGEAVGFQLMTSFCAHVLPFFSAL